ncbi:MAG: AAA family ATPase, partial [Clostridia bacterium]|nr:AAA family ATPase [Clostridia bacterium]
GIKFVLTKCAANGHCYLPESTLIEDTCRLLDVDADLVQHSIKELFNREQIIVEQQDGERIIYSLAFYRAEMNVCKRLIRLILSEAKQINIDVDNDIKTVEFEQGIKLAQHQRQAVKEAMTNGVLVITGGPGTGKTTIINAIIRMLKRQGVTISLAAPTGRAAKRMTETTGQEAKTIHRLLEYGPSEDEQIDVFSKDELNPLDTDVVIVDEVSMVDILLMNSLLKAIAPGTRLILVGDVDQLPSVGPGNVLRDIINSGIIKTVRLQEIFRQAEESMIIVNAHRINQGLMPYVNIGEKDFYLDRKASPGDILDTVIDLCSLRLPKYFKLHPLKDIQVLSPMKKGTTGVRNLNIQLQKVLNPPSRDKNEYIEGENIYRVGDKVMQIKNNYQMKWEKINWVDRRDREGLGIFNGDVGYITDINKQDRTLKVVLDDDKLVSYEFSQLDELELAYAVSVHKSQGSEFPAVIIPLCWGPPMLMTRNLLYTAVTRARDLVVVVGREAIMGKMIANNHIAKRFSALDRRLKEEFVRWDERS